MKRSSLVQTIVFISAFLVMASEAQASEPIEVVYGRGREQLMKQLMNAQTQFKDGNLAAARATLDTLIRSDPKFYPAYYVRAEVLSQQNKYDEAMQDCNEALRQDSTFAEASLLRAEINLARGRCAESLKEIDHVISIHPRQDALARAYHSRARLRLSCPDSSFRNEHQAVKDAMAACRLMEWHDENVIDTLAMAFARTGDFDSAVRYEEKALKIKGATTEDSKRLQKNLELFKQHRTG